MVLPQVYKLGHPALYSTSGNKLQKADGTLDDNHQPKSRLFDDGTGMVRLLLTIHKRRYIRHR